MNEFISTGTHEPPHPGEQDSQSLFSRIFDVHQERLEQAKDPAAGLIAARRTVAMSSSIITVEQVVGSPYDLSPLFFDRREYVTDENRERLLSDQTTAYQVIDRRSFPAQEWSQQEDILSETVKITRRGITNPYGGNTLEVSLAATKKMTPDGSIVYEAHGWDGCVLQSVGQMSEKEKYILFTNLNLK